MPYIDPSDRALARYHPRTPGELNYAMCMLIIHYLRRKGINYTILNDCLGALSGAKLEFHRRVVAAYEDGKIADNGDIPWHAEDV